MGIIWISPYEHNRSDGMSIIPLHGGSIWLRLLNDEERCIVLIDPSMVIGDAGRPVPLIESIFISHERFFRH
jgi:hypothetical protein